jgi:hypothetical protein
MSPPWVFLYLSQKTTTNHLWPAFTFPIEDEKRSRNRWQASSPWSKVKRRSEKVSIICPFVPMILVALHSWAIKLLVGSPDKMAPVVNILSSDASLSRLRRATYGRSVFVTSTLTLRMYIARHRVQWGCWSVYFVSIESTQELRGNVV